MADPIHPNSPPPSRKTDEVFDTIKLVGNQIANRYAGSSNTAQTWNDARTDMNMMLHSLWHNGSLWGATPDEAYTIRCGLGQSMTAQDIVEGRMRIEIEVALEFPGKYTAIAFERQMSNAENP